MSLRRMRAYGMSLIVCLLAASMVLAQPAGESGMRRGLWITCFAKQNVLGSQSSIDGAVSFARQHGFDIIFMQVYRGDQAWFDSLTADASPFQKNRQAAGMDTFRAFIDKAHDAGIEVHAWINTLTLSKNQDAPILKRLGNGILTTDQHGRTALRSDSPNPYDTYYGREDQLFLEAGDPRVQEHVRRIVVELVERYPDLDGIHFDYIRYPANPPYIPGSRFNPIGLSYGYGQRNVERFRQSTGIDPYRVDWDVPKSLAWDAWRRDQVTEVLSSAGRAARVRNPKIKISCAAIQSIDRAYYAASQDWGRWAEEGLVDFVVLMNYSVDSRFVVRTTRAAMGVTGGGARLMVGLGAHLMQENPKEFAEQMRLVGALRPGGIAVFDYTTIADSPLAEAVAGAFASRGERE